MGKMNFATELKGNRVDLRVHPVSFEHAATVYNSIDKNREHLAILQSTVEVYSPEDVFKDFLLGAVQRGLNEQSRYEYMVLRDNKYIGHLGVFNIDRKNAKVELGYWLYKEYTGNGYMSEALALLEKHLFAIGVNRIEIKIGNINEESNKMAKCANYIYEGSLREFKTFRGDFYDLNIYSKLKSDV